ncbi:MAG: TonB-dependent receptor plug domain-containing protein [Opitutaceae bacterium]|nr:TonB-dependent receptor plug domain-containing protein [Verrucomicrobiales bacterium]
MSPFEVAADNRGYYAANTMAGTRIGSKLEDLGASITVVTKEQMLDFAMLDINDIFNYEASTEGTGNYTAFSFNRNGQASSDAQLDPQNANRIRGMSSVNVTLGNFATSGWTPIDPLNIDAVEISRGPNASIFGIGNVGGTVNSVAAAANVTRNKTQVTARWDSNDGYRGTLDLNRVIFPGVLALCGSVAYQHDGFHLKPSGTDTTRYNAMVKYRPFKRTMLTASYSTYRLDGNRPNVTTPRDGITDWVNRGSPTWDTTTLSAKLNGVVVATAIPAYFDYATISYSNIYVDRPGIAYWQTGQGTSSTLPNTAGPAPLRRLVTVIGAPEFVTQPLFERSKGLTNKSLYDWSSINLAAMNRVHDQTNLSTVLLDQTFLDSPRQLLGLQLGYFREAGARRARNINGGVSGTAIVSILQVDVNEKLINGSPNPFFGSPFIGEIVPSWFTRQITNDTYRGQLVYKLDLRQEKNLLHWAGMHQVTGYSEYKHYVARAKSWQDRLTSVTAWPKGNVGLGYFRYYVGDASGNNVDYPPGDIQYGNYTLNYGNSTNGFTQETVGLGPLALTGNSNSLTILKTQGAIVQSHLLRDRVVTTFGFRRDRRYGKGGITTRYLPDGLTIDDSTYTQWSPANWGFGGGNTKTAGIVVKPLRWLSVFANKSGSFQPAFMGQDIYLRRLPDPTGKGEDYGFALNLFSGKLNVRVNKYQTSEIKRRNGESGTLAQRVQRIEFRNNAQNAVDIFQLQRKAESWVVEGAAAQGQTLTDAQIEQQVSTIMKLPVEYLRPFEAGVSATDDNIGKGMEIEVNYNPTNFWTMKFNVAKQRSIGASIAPEMTQWIKERLAVWQTIIDPTLVNPDGSLGRPWYTEPYNNGQSAKQFMDGNVIAPLNLYQALEGKSKPQVRQYRANFSTNLRLSGITEQRILKRFNVGGAFRWEDKGAIGFYSVQQPPVIATTLDGTRPIYDQSRYYVDAFMGYRTPFLSNKVTATVQLNVRNVTESGRLQAISARPDGVATAFRIVDPRLFILSVTFDL